MNRRLPGLAWLVVPGLVCALAGSLCGQTPISRALGYLSRTQVTQDLEGPPNRDFAGDWPQYITVASKPGLRVRDVSPFIPAFIHQALTFVTEDSAGKLGLTLDEAQEARVMRQRVAGLVRRFEANPGEPDAGTYGFWPYDLNAGNRFEPLADLSAFLFIGPELQGTRFPVNIPFYPPSLAFPTDADDTAAAYLVLLNDARVDGGPGSDVPFEKFFADWRDRGQVPLRFNPYWLPPASGAFLTWFNYKNPPDYTIPNDVDLTVNANVLHVLARYGRLDTPGVAETIRLINETTQSHVYRTDYEHALPYYANQGYMFHFVVTRAFAEGPIPELQPAVDVLADELEREAISLPDGTNYWDKGSAQLDTALAVLALMNAGRNSGVLKGGIAYLVAEQSRNGSWDEGVFFTGRTDNGTKFNWESRALTTALALEALVRYELGR